MTSKLDNQHLTEVGKGTLMGDFMRLFWVPALPSADLQRNGDPIRMRLLGEDMIAFRDSNNTVGLLAPHCAHRRADLYFGRNEDCGLRCVYHGWKFDVTGTCTDTPNTRATMNVRQKAFRAEEKNGIIWAYLGDDEPPALPEFEFNNLPQENVYWSLRVQDCNWLQGVEGNVDSTHAPLLHRRIDGRNRAAFFDFDNEAHFQARDQDFGVLVAARRAVPAGGFHWRVNNFIFPYYAMIPPLDVDPRLQLAIYVPMDDVTTMAWLISYDPAKALSREVVDLYSNTRRDGTETGHLSPEATLGEDEVDGTLPYRKYWPRYHRANNYGINHDRQRYKYYSGLPGIWPQDGGIQGSMGEITDRSDETLCSSDLGIVKTRRSLLQAARDYADTGTRPPSAKDPTVFRVRVVARRSDSEDLDEAVGPFLYREGDYGYVVG